jgi:hypothetical protein
VTNLVRVASLIVAATMTSTICAETKCPGNVESVPLHPVNGYQMIVAVSVNHSGPYNFLLDTGTEFTMIDPSLAEELHSRGDGAISVDGTGFHSAGSSTLVGPVEIGSHAVAHLETVLYNLQELRSVNVRIRGVLGEDFLKHFDVLIDNDRRFLCLDESGAMRSEVKGVHVAMVTPSAGEDVPSNAILFTANLSDLRRPVRLKLDSGATASVLYNPTQYQAPKLVRGALRHGSGTNGVQRNFAALPAQSVKIGSLQLHGVPFFALAENQSTSTTAGFDGLLSTGLFRLIFLCHSDHFAVLETR